MIDNASGNASENSNEEPVQVTSQQRRAAAVGAVCLRLSLWTNKRTN